MSDKSLPQREYVPQTGHKYAIGARVKNVAPWSQRYSETGTIVKLLPWGHNCAYDVQYDSGGVYPVAELNVEVVKEGGESETGS